MLSVSTVGSEHLSRAKAKKARLLYNPEVLAIIYPILDQLRRDEVCLPRVHWPADSHQSATAAAPPQRCLPPP